MNCVADNTVRWFKYTNFLLSILLCLFFYQLRARQDFDENGSMIEGSLFYANVTVGGDRMEH